MVSCAARNGEVLDSNPFLYLQQDDSLPTSCRKSPAKVTIWGYGFLEG
jgi:hypothetical protein